jgi:hypothetical protein
MSDSTEIQPLEGSGPRPALQALGDRLVGTWKVSGEAEGETTWYGCFCGQMNVLPRNGRS